MSTDDAFVLSVKYCTINNRVPATPDYFFFFPSFLCVSIASFSMTGIANAFEDFLFFFIAGQDKNYTAVALNEEYLKYE